MINLVQSKTYRNDIDGLRGIAVLAVILFHFGYLPNGFLGVDIFFVISGFLITEIIYRKIVDNQFSIVDFYLRRARRILPLVLFVILVSLLIGIVTMLPDDLENLAQSVIATNLFINNILLLITTRNYWDVVNEYKPLMHTWSLGIEQQFYLFYPFLFTLVGKKRISWLLPLIAFTTGVSLILYLSPYHQDFEKFYLIYFRFWEISAGGILAILLKNRLIYYKWSFFPILLLIFLLCSNSSAVAPQVALLITILLTLGIVGSSNQSSNVSTFILENKVLGSVGKISFSLYLWHQVLLAYGRYFWVQELTPIHLGIILIITIILSVGSYSFIEEPFRNKNKISTKNLLIVLLLGFVITSTSSFYLYINAGVLKDIPELEISRSSIERNMHGKYNYRIRQYYQNFSSINKVKVLVIGNSFARDWANVLLESQYSNKLEISYIEHLKENSELQNRVEQSNIIFYSTPTLIDAQKNRIDLKKLWAVGTKNFGTNNGIFYNYKGNDYYGQRTLMKKGYVENNEKMKQEWGGRYIDYIDKVIDSKQMVPVFTPSNHFISQDCVHFTKAGAKYYAQIFEKDLDSIFSKL